MKQVREDGSPKGAEMAHRLADAYRRGDLGLISSIMDDEGYDGSHLARTPDRRAQPPLG